MSYTISDSIMDDMNDMEAATYALYDSAVKRLLKTDPNDPFATHIVELVHMWDEHDAMRREGSGDGWTEEEQDEMEAKHAKPFSHVCCDKCQWVGENNDCEECENKGSGHVLVDYVFVGEFAEIHTGCIHCDYMVE
jgi:hypothetical protein